MTPTDAHELTPYLQSLDMSPSYIDTCVRIVKRFERWMNEESLCEGQLRYADFMAFMEFRQRGGVTQRTIQAELSSLKHYCNYLVEAGVLTANPILKLNIRGVKRGSLYDILEPEELTAIYHGYQPEISGPSTLPLFGNQQVDTSIHTFHRNRCLLGLFIFQGATTGEITLLTPDHLNLSRNIIHIPKTLKTNARTLSLDPKQAIHLDKYMMQSRETMLDTLGIDSDQLFFSWYGSSRLHFVLELIMKELRKTNPQISYRRIRASVITNWIKHYNLRQVQLMAGHRYLSSTEKYKRNDWKGMKRLIDVYHPLG